MATKVKGDKIKEGSIPLSALATEVKDKIEKLVNITYLELKSLKDNSQLVPGQQYRITDYVTTTAQDNTQSARNQFDIIVTADSTNTLNEEARACLHEGDTYFSNAGAKLEAWKIWYSLDNDTNRFAWTNNTELLYTIKKINTFSFKKSITSIVFNKKKYILKLGVSKNISSGPPIYVTLVDDNTIKVDSVSNGANSYITQHGGIEVYSEGKGVIYRMIDEWNNDCPYDFKNIQFNRGVYDGGGIAPDGDEDLHLFLYTFSFITNELTEVLDTSIFGNNGRLLNDEGQITGVYGNVIGQFMNYDGSIEHPTKTTQSLNNIVFCSYYDYDGGTYYGCYSNTFGNNCSNNSLGNYCSNNSLGNYYQFNKVDDGVSVTLKNNENGSSNQQVQNYHFTRGLNKRTIEVNRNRAYETTIGIDSSGNVREFCIADMFDI